MNKKIIKLIKKFNQLLEDGIEISNMIHVASQKEQFSKLIEELKESCMQLN